MAETINEWVFSFRDDENFISSSRKGIWGMTETRPIHTHFIKNVKEGDRLWFKSKGKLIAAARHKKGEITRERTVNQFGLHECGVGVELRRRNTSNLL